MPLPPVLEQMWLNFGFMPSLSHKDREKKVVLSCAAPGSDKAHVHCRRQKTKIFLSILFLISSQQFFFFFYVFIFSLLLKIGLSQIRSLGLLTFH